MSKTTLTNNSSPAPSLKKGSCGSGASRTSRSGVTLKLQSQRQSLRRNKLLIANMRRWAKSYIALTKNLTLMPNQPTDLIMKLHLMELKLTARNTPGKHPR